MIIIGRKVKLCLNLIILREKLYIDYFKVFIIEDQVFLNILNKYLDIHIREDYSFKIKIKIYKFLYVI